MAAELPRISTQLPGPKASALIARDAAVLSPSYTRPYPFVMARGEGAIVEDVDGNRFLDFNAGIAVVAAGHAHPHVVKAVQEQAAKFLHMSGTDFYYENMVELAEKLASLAPGGGPERVYFGNSGTEAIEAAMKMARYHTGRQQFIAFFGSFHGRTMGALSLTGSKNVQKKGFFPLVPGVHHAPYPNCYRCPFGTSPDRCAVECVRYIEDTIMRQVVPPEEIAAIFLEPVQGEGGYIVPPQKFVDELQALAAKARAFCWCSTRCNAEWAAPARCSRPSTSTREPDIIALAKGIASGMPLSATVARAEIMDWKPGSHASTFGGNPVSVAASLATIELLERELMRKCGRDRSPHHRRACAIGPRRFPIVGDVRGLGLDDRFRTRLRPADERACAGTARPNCNAGVSNEDF